MAFSIIGSLVAFIVPLMIIGTMRPENSGRVFTMGIIFGAACAPCRCCSLSLGPTRNPEYYTQSQPSLRNSFRAVWKNRPFLFAAGIFLFTWTAADIIQAFLLYFLKYRMNLEGQSDIILGAIFITALLVLPFWELGLPENGQAQGLRGRDAFPLGHHDRPHLPQTRPPDCRWCWSWPSWQGSAFRRSTC